MTKPKGELTVVGTGIQLGHITAQARAWIEKAEKVLYCVGDAATERWIQKLNPNSESLYVLYGDDKRRIETYREMVARTLECVRADLKVCMVFYGHPGIFVYPSHEAIKQARAEGYRAVMLPAVSSLDCLFADLGIDPASGCQMIEATDLLIRERRIDTSFNLIIWQAGAVGDLGFRFKGFDGRNVPVLQEVLASIYGDDHECTVYEASQYSVCDPLIRRIRVRDIASAGLTGISTIHLAPKMKAQLDMPMLERLGLDSAIKERLARLQVKPVSREVGAD
jgi:precorrin-6B methylase 1